MSVVICCPCGTPIDFEHLELVVSLSCPQCKRELDLEIENGPVDRRRAVLTVMAGPHWVGERFILPIGVDLQIGQANNNWISLEDEGVSDVHCRLNVHSDGSLTVEDRQSKTGTWIGEQRIAKGKLAAKQSLRIGAFRMRLDYQTVDGSTIVSAPPSPVMDSSGFLPTMQRVGGKKTKMGALRIHRYRIARWIILAVGAASGLYNAIELHSRPALQWRWPTAAATGLLIAVSLIATGRRITLAHKQLKFVPVGLLGVLAIVDLVWGMPLPAACELGAAAALFILIIQTDPPIALAVIGTGAGALWSIMMVIGAIVSLARLGK